MNNEITCFCCVETYNKTTRLKIQCPFYDKKEKCNYHVCKECAKKYILSSNLIAQCMKCKNVYSRSFMIEHFGRHWVDNEYKKHLSNILFETEIIKSKENMKDAIHYKSINNLLHQNVLLHEQKNKIIKEMHLVNKQIYENNNKLLYYQTKYKDECKKLFYIKKCSVTNCNGFLNQDGLCEMCNTTVCLQCLELKKNDHKCNKDTIATIKMLQNDTKQCPVCNVLTSKIDGCDQMWCVKCRTAWDWKSRNIIYGKIHNPHFYNFQRKMNNGVITRDIDDIECSQPVPHSSFWNHQVCRSFLDFKQNHSEYKSLFTKKLPRIYNKYLILLDILDKKRNELEHLRDNKYIRIKYIVGEIKKETFKKELVQKYNDVTKWTHIIYLYELFELIWRESINFIFHIERDKTSSTIEINEIKQIMFQLHKIDMIRLHVNQELAKISYEYKHMIKGFDHNYNIKKIAIHSKEELRLYLDQQR